VADRAGIFPVGMPGCQGPLLCFQPPYFRCHLLIILLFEHRLSPVLPEILNLTNRIILQRTAGVESKMSSCH